MVEYADLREALRRLPERERQVIALRFYHGDAAARGELLPHLAGAGLAARAARRGAYARVAGCLGSRRILRLLFYLCT